MPRGGRRAGAGRPAKYVKDLGNTAPQLAGRFQRIAALARQIETKCGTLVSSLAEDAKPGRLVRGLAALAKLGDEMAAERAAISGTLQGEPPKSKSLAAPEPHRDLFGGDV
jgi:hypothetical protein